MSQQINLYNRIFLKQEKHFSARTMAQALGVIALSLAALCGYAYIESRAAERSAQQYRDQIAAQRKQMVQLAGQLAGRGRSKALEAEVARLEAQLKQKKATLEALGTGVLGNTTGFSEFLAAFSRQTMSGVWLTSVSVDDSGNALVVQGRALRPELVPAYLRALNVEEMMRGRSVTEMKLASRSAPPAIPGSSAKAQGPDRYIEFSLVAPLQVAAPELAKKGAP